MVRYLSTSLYPISAIIFRVRYLSTSNVPINIINLGLGIYHLPMYPMNINLGLGLDIYQHPMYPINKIYVELVLDIYHLPMYPTNVTNFGQIIKTLEQVHQYLAIKALEHCNASINTTLNITRTNT